MLYICPTPIGNLKDITLRTLDVLKECTLILAEDTRNARKILSFYNISGKKIISYHRFSEKKKLFGIVQKLKNGVDIAMITDAGTPAISDPGYILLKSCIEQNIRFTVLPGATALIPALLLSGFDPSRFTFVGFLPRKNRQREELLKELSSIGHPVILYVSPHRLLEELNSIKELFGDVRASLSRELTKQFEETIRDKISDIILQLSDKEIKGEYVLTVGKKPDERENKLYETIIHLFKKTLKREIKEKELAKEVARIFNRKTKEVYEILEKEE